MYALSIFPALACLQVALGPAAAQTQTSVLRQLTNPMIVVTYGAPDGKPETLKWMQDQLILERVAQFMSPIKLPRVLTITSGGPSKGCPETEPNMFFSPSADELVVCYSYIDWWKDLVASSPTISGISRDDILAGGFAGVLLHEAGHALSHMLEIPVLGREEDSADQMSAILMMEFSPRLSRAALRGYAYTLQRFGDDTPNEAILFFDEHGTPSQRFYNTICIAYGKNPGDYESIVKLAKFPVSRLANCKWEYEQIKHAFSKTIAPHIDRAKADKVRSVNWVAPVRRRG